MTWQKENGMLYVIGFYASHIFFMRKQNSLLLLLLGISTIISCKKKDDPEIANKPTTVDLRNNYAGVYDVGKHYISQQYDSNGKLLKSTDTFVAQKIVAWFRLGDSISVGHGSNIKTYPMLSFYDYPLDTNSKPLYQYALLSTGSLNADWNAPLQGYGYFSNTDSLHLINTMQSSSSYYYTDTVIGKRIP